LLEESARIREIAQAGRNQLVGLLKLGVIYTVGPYLLPDLVPALHARAPQMRSTSRRTDRAPGERAQRRGASTRRSSRLPFQPPGVVTEFLYERAVPGRRAARAQMGEAQIDRADELPAEHTILLNVGHCFRDQVLDACPELNRAERR